MEFPIVAFQINSTATNLASTLLSVFAGFLLGQFGLALKARADRDSKARLAAKAILTEILVNTAVLVTWRRLQEREAGLAANLLLPGALGPLQFGSLELACVSGVFDHVPELLHPTHNLLANFRGADSARAAREFAKAASTNVRMIRAMTEDLVQHADLLDQQVPAVSSALERLARDPWWVKVMMRVRSFASPLGRRPPKADAGKEAA